MKRFSISVCFLGAFVLMTIAAAGFPSSRNVTMRPNVDQYISPQLSLEERAVIRRVMVLLPPAHWQNVIFFDVANGGRIYVNKPELKTRAFYFREDPMRPGYWLDPYGGAIVAPIRVKPEFIPNRFGKQIMVADSVPPNSDTTGPFHRNWVMNTSWIADSMFPSSFPVPVPSGGSGYQCNGDVFKPHEDSGYMYAGGFANTNLSNPTEAEAGGFIQDTSPTKGFGAFMDASPENTTQTKVGYLGFWGCLSPIQQTQNTNVVFSVISPTLIEGFFGGYLDSRTCVKPCVFPPWKSVTITMSQSADMGWNLAGTNELTFINVSIAQLKPSPLPSHYPGYNLDGSHFAAVHLFANGSLSQAGIGTYNNPVDFCDINDPTGYDSGQGGPCSGSFPVAPATHPFPTPLPRVVYAWESGGPNPEDVDICLAYAPCALPTIYCDMTTLKCP